MHWQLSKKHLVWTQLKKVCSPKMASYYKHPYECLISAPAQETKKWKNSQWNICVICSCLIVVVVCSAPLLTFLAILSFLCIVLQDLKRAAIKIMINRRELYAQFNYYLNESKSETFPHQPWPQISWIGVEKQI